MSNYHCYKTFRKVYQTISSCKICSIDTSFKDNEEKFDNFMFRSNFAKEDIRWCIGTTALFYNYLRLGNPMNTLTTLIYLLQVWLQFSRRKLKWVALNSFMWYKNETIGSLIWSKKFLWCLWEYRHQDTFW